MATITSTVVGRSNLAQASIGSGAPFLYGREATQVESGISVLSAWNHPVLTLLNKIGTVQSQTIQFNWFETVDRPYIDQINWGTGYTTGTGLTVDNSSYFAVGDVVRVEATGETMLVTSVGTNYIGVVRDYGQTHEGWTARRADIADNYYLQRIGNAFMQGAAMPTLKKVLESEKVNYIQEFRTPFGVTEDVFYSQMRGESVFPFEASQAAVDHQRKQELALLFSMPAKGSTGATQPAYDSAATNLLPTTTGGVDYFLVAGCDAARLVDQADLTESEFIDFLEVAFEYGSQEKYLFASPELQTAFAKWALTKEMTKSGKMVRGIMVTDWLTPQGKMLHIIEHRALKRSSTSDTNLYNYNYVLDLENISKVGYGPYGVTGIRTPIKYENGDGKTLIKQEYFSKTGLIVRLPNTHARLRFKTASAA